MINIPIYALLIVPECPWIPCRLPYTNIIIIIIIAITLTIIDTVFTTIVVIIFCVEKVVGGD